MKDIISSQSNIFAAVVNSSLKFRPNDEIPDQSSPIIKLAGAKNEYETVQVLIKNKKIETTNKVFAEISDLKGPEGVKIAADDINIFIAHCFYVSEVSDSLCLNGMVPDALVPLKIPFTIKAGENKALWIKVYISADKPAGIYIGNLNIKIDNETATTIPVMIEVWDIKMPLEKHFYSCSYIDFDSIKRHENIFGDEETFQNETLPLYYDALINCGVYPSNLYKVLPEIIEENEKITVDFYEFDLKCKQIYNGKIIGPFRIPFDENVPINTSEYPRFSDEYNDRVVKYLKQCAEYFEKMGILDQTYLYIDVTDEPGTYEKYELTAKYSELIKKADPRLRMLLTIFTKCHDKPEASFRDIDFDNILWCPNIAFFDGYALKVDKFLENGEVEISHTSSGMTPEFSLEQKKKGKECWCYIDGWTYMLGEPLKSQINYPTCYLDRPGIEHRILPWTAYKYNLSVIGHWNSTYWPEGSNPWAAITRGEVDNQGPNANGSLMYPSYGSSKYTGQPEPTGPINSIRLELLREGIEDYELLYMLAKNGKSELAEKIVNDLIQSFQDCDIDPDKLVYARQCAVDALLGR